MLTRLAFSLSGFEKQQTRCTDVFVIFMRGSHRARARASYSLAWKRAETAQRKPGRITSSWKIWCRIAGCCKDKHEEPTQLHQSLEQEPATKFVLFSMEDARRLKYSITLNLRLSFQRDCENWAITLKINEIGSSFGRSFFLSLPLICLAGIWYLTLFLVTLF